MSAASSSSFVKLSAYTNVGEVLQNSTLHGKLVKIRVEQRANALGQFARVTHVAVGLVNDLVVYQKWRIE